MRLGGMWHLQQVVSQLVSIVVVLLLSPRLLQVYRTRHIAEISDSYRRSQRSKKDPNVLKHKPKM
jgi:hypothetical protein